MTENNDPRPALSPELFWRVLLVGNLLSLGVVLLVFHQLAEVAMAPMYGGWILGAGLLMVAPGLLYRRHAMRRQERMVREGMSENSRQLTRLNQLVVGCALAEVPGLLGGVYYLFSREWGGTSVLLLATVTLLWLAKPR